MKKFVAMVIGLVAGGALVGVPAAQAHKVSVPSSIEVLGWDRSLPGDGTLDFAYGIVRSEDSRCVGKRTVKVYRDVNGQMLLIDTARTSDKGFWAGGGDFKIGDGGQAYVMPKKLPLTRKQRKQNKKRPGTHVHRCAGAPSAIWD